MLQLTKSLFTRRGSDHVIPDNGDNVYSNIKPEKLYTQKEVNDLLKQYGIKPSPLESEMEKESKAADKQRRNENRTVENLVRKSNRILFSISSHAFPIDLFPNTINIEEGRITIINRHFLSSEIHSVDIRNISNIFINNTLFFSQLVIISKTYEENEIRVRNLRTTEAIYARRIIEGLRVFESNQIDTSHYSKAGLISRLEELSKTKIVT
jgi:hypothetical protein